MDALTITNIFDFFLQSCIAGLGVIGMCSLFGLGVKSMLRMFQ